MAKDSKNQSPLSVRFTTLVNAVKAAEESLNTAKRGLSTLAEEVYAARQSAPFTHDGGTYVAMRRQKVTKDAAGKEVPDGPPSYFFKSLSPTAPEPL